MSASCQAHRGRRSAAAARRRSTATAAAATEATAAETADMDTPPPSMRTPPPKPPQLPRSRPVAAAPQLPVAAAPLQLPVVLPPARLAVDVATRGTGTEATSPLSPVLQVRSGEGSTAAPAAAAAPTPAEAAAAAQRASAPPLPWSPPQRPLSACAQDATHSRRNVGCQRRRVLLHPAPEGGMMLPDGAGRWPSRLLCVRGMRRRPLTVRSTRPRTEGRGGGALMGGAASARQG